MFSFRSRAGRNYSNPGLGLKNGDITKCWTHGAIVSHKSRIFCSAFLFKSSVGSFQLKTSPKILTNKFPTHSSRQGTVITQRFDRYVVNPANLDTTNSFIHTIISHLSSFALQLTMTKARTKVAQSRWTDCTTLNIQHHRRLRTVELVATARQ